MATEIERHPEVLAHLDSVDGVVFDYGGVLAVNPHEKWEAYPWCERHGLSRAAHKAGMAKYRNLFDGGEMTCAEMYRRIFADNELEALSDGELEELYRVDSEGWVTMCRPSLELMKELRAAGKKVGILTNMSEAFYRDYFLRLAHEFAAAADLVVVSGLIKMHKPERPIYDYTAEHLGIAPSRLLFLDDLEPNVNAARAAGWQAEIFTQYR